MHNAWDLAHHRLSPCLQDIRQSCHGIQQARPVHRRKHGHAAPTCQAAPAVEAPRAAKPEVPEYKAPPKIAGSVTELIGNTPMVYLNKVRCLWLCMALCKHLGSLLIMHALCTDRQGRQCAYSGQAGNAGALPQREGPHWPQHD